MGLTVKYWQTKSKAEVDFVIDKDGSMIPVEVKLRATAGKVERSMRSFISAYKPKVAVVVFYNGNPGTMNVDGCKVVFTDVSGLPRLLAQ